MVESKIITLLKRYIIELSSLDIRASKLILFGSYAKGNADQYSDIDLVVIAPEFDGPRENTMVEKLWLATLPADNRIEPIPCGEKEWGTDQTRPILEIARREGIVITA